MLNRIFLIHDKEEENILKEALMKRSGIPNEYLTFQNVYYKDDKNDYVHLMLIDDQRVNNKRDLVFLHGLSSSSIFYYGILRELSKKFRIFAIDIPGMGWYFYFKKALQEMNWNLTTLLIMKITF